MAWQESKECFDRFWRAGILWAREQYSAALDEYLWIWKRGEEVGDAWANARYGFLLRGIGKVVFADASLQPLIADLIRQTERRIGTTKERSLDAEDVIHLKQLMQDLAGC